MDKPKIVIGMSGGVDSSVATYLLKKQGYDCIGATMQIWEENREGNSKSSQTAVADAKAVAEKLGVSHYVVDFKETFYKNVVQYFMDEYLQGRTPNPCVVCNRHVKWQALLDRGAQLGAEYIATGHYAKIEKHPKTGRLALRMSAAKGKDQTYVLYNLTQEQLSKTIMPLGSYNKEEIRKIAEEIGLTVADKKDSMEICFIPDDDYTRFIKDNSNTQMKTGNFVDGEGNVLGQHKGIIHYTIGQRKGLGIALGKPVFVSEIRPETNEVVLSGNESLFRRTVRAVSVNFMAYERIDGEMRAEAKIRYSHKKAPCTLRQTGVGEIECVFDEPQRAITPGQALVVYDGDYVLCGGTII